MVGTASFFGAAQAYVALPPAPRFLSRWQITQIFDPNFGYFCLLQYSGKCGIINSEREVRKMMKFEVTRMWYSYDRVGGRNIPVRHSATKIVEANSIEEIKKEAKNSDTPVWVRKI